MASKPPKQRKFVSVSETAAETIDDGQSAQEAVKKADSPAEKTPKGKATGLRITAIIFWLAAIAFEVLVVCKLNGVLYIPGDETVWLIVGLALDLICVVTGSFIWKHANRIDPASEKNKIKFFLWNNMGVIAATIALLPLLIILLKNKKLDAKIKRIVTIVAAIALVLAVGLSIDYNPVSSEDLAAAKTQALVQNNGTTYWTRWGRSYHFDPNCRTLLNSSIVYQGSMEEAFSAHRTDPCDFCAGGGDLK